LILWSTYENCDRMNAASSSSTAIDAPFPTPALSLGSRAWRAFGATPWWRLVAGGMLVIVSTFFLMLPFDTMRMANRIRSEVGKEALKISLQREVLERARGGLLVVRGLTHDDEAVAEIDSTIADIEQEMSKPIIDTFDGDAEQLRKEIQTLRKEAEIKSRELSAAANKMAAGALSGNPTSSEKIEELSSELADLTLRLNQLLRQQKSMQKSNGSEDKKSSSDEAIESGKFTLNVEGKEILSFEAKPPGKMSGGEKTKSTESGKFKLNVEGKELLNFEFEGKTAPKSVAPASRALAATPVPPTAPITPAPPTMSTALATVTAAAATNSITPIAEPTIAQIAATVSRDTTKFIYAGTTLLALTILFIFMLIARAFAGRAARGEQRAVIAESRERTESHARQLAEARLTLMRAQVEPHFLFNTLAHVQALQEIDPPQASTMLERLISYLRAAMPSMRETTSTLGREIEVVRAYLDLLKIRMGDRLRYVINVPTDLNNVALPPTMIATLVENAIKHGLEPKKEGGTIAINVRKLPGENGASDTLEVLVADDGLGLGGAQTAGTGVGLVNTRERLKMLYGSAAELVVEPNAPSGVRALMRVPTSVPEIVSQGVDDYGSDTAQSGVSRYTMQTVGLLALFVGWLGVHRFYVGHKRTGGLQAALGILTFLSGAVPVFALPLLMWVLLDLVWIVTRDFTDGRGLRVARLDAKDNRAYADIRVPSRPREASASAKSRSIAMIFVLLLGLIGAHRFYVGRIGSGLAMLFTIGGLGLWWLIDVVIVASGQLKDDQGKWVSEWE
jgi:TM2 domain-containing membrane protein YozV/two-component sensor histidine kinase